MQEPFQFCYLPGDEGAQLIEMFDSDVSFESSGGTFGGESPTLLVDQDRYRMTDLKGLSREDLENLAQRKDETYTSGPYGATWVLQFLGENVYFKPYQMHPILVFKKRQFRSALQQINRYLA